ncbi:MAG: hypothetical protein AAF703_06930 [Cyanobacteria bacterium P01_D01_bin.105]
MPHLPNVGFPISPNSAEHSDGDINYSPKQCTPDLSLTMHRLLSEPIYPPPAYMQNAQALDASAATLQNPVIEESLLQPLSSATSSNQPPVAANSNSRTFNRSPEDSWPEDNVAAPNLTMLPTAELAQLKLKVEQQAAQIARYEAQTKALQNWRSQPQKSEDASARRVAVSPPLTVKLPQTAKRVLPDAVGYANNPQRRSVKQRKTIPEPALQPTTYLLPRRSQELTWLNKLRRGVPPTILLFLLGTFLACAVGVLYPLTVSLPVLSNLVVGMLKSLALAICFSLTILFVLEFRA